MGKITKNFLLKKRYAARYTKTRTKKTKKMRKTRMTEAQFCKGCHSCRVPCGREEKALSDNTVEVKLSNIEYAYQQARYFQECSLEDFIKILKG